MDDGREMSDGVQAKVPIRGQPEGGVSPTAANGRRLGETATVANTPAPTTILTPPRQPHNHPTNQLTTQDAVLSALLCILWPHTSQAVGALHPLRVRACVCASLCVNCMRLQKVASCMYSQECGSKT